MAIKSITIDKGGYINITSEEGTIKVTKQNPSYEGLKLQFLSLGINAWNWTKNLEKYSPLRQTEETLLYDSQEGQMKIPFPNMDYTSYQEKKGPHIGSEGQYWTQDSTVPYDVYFNEEWNK